MNTIHTAFLVVGSPGGGKRTLGDALVTAQIKHEYLEMGEILRAVAKADTHDGHLIREYQADGRLVPDELTLAVARAHVTGLTNCKVIVCDGFPRTIEQTAPAVVMLTELNFTKFVVINIETDEEICVQRLVKSKRGRVDDGDEAVARARIELFKRDTLPLIQHIKTHLPQLNCDFITVSGNDMKRDGARYVSGLAALYGLQAA
jgi:adenylate kinase